MNTSAKTDPVRVFEVTLDEQRRVDEWVAQTDAKLKAEGVSSYAGAIGGRLTYYFTDTTLGRVLKVKDSVTNEELDLTDYDAW